MKIIIDRVLREGPAWDIIIRDIAGTDMERRDKALACLRFLCPYSNLLLRSMHDEVCRSFAGVAVFGSRQAEIVICRHSTYKAIVDCLCNLLPEAQIAEKDPTFRTQPERNALYLIHQIVSMDVAKALEAGVISRWLAQYPFGGLNASTYNKKKTVMDLIDNGRFNEDSEFRDTMQSMLRYMSSTPALRKEMVEHGLLDVPKGNDITVDVNFSRCEKRPWTDYLQDDWQMTEASPRTYAYIDRTRRGIPVGTSNRLREDSFEEQALRRRRREAMVLGEVGRPIQRADIIERDTAALDEIPSPVMASLFDEREEESEQPVTAVADEDVEEELELLMEEITQSESTRHRGWWSWLTSLRPDGLARGPL